MSEKLNLQQKLRFQVLVNFHMAMEKKRKQDEELGYLQSAADIYTEAIDAMVKAFEEAIKDNTTDDHTDCPWSSECNGYNSAIEDVMYAIGAIK